MKKCRITVMKVARYDDLIEKYENPIEHACDMKEGQVFIANGWERPDGFCLSAWESMSAFVLALLNISSLSDTPDRKKSDTLTAKILHPFRIDGAWRPHGLRTAATPLDHSEIAFSRLMDSPLMVST